MEQSSINEMRWDEMFSLQKMAMAFAVLVFTCLCSFVSPDAQGDAFSYLSTAIFSHFLVYFW